MAERRPGIIVRTLNDTSVIVPPTFQRYPLYIGMGDPYRLIDDARVVRSVGIVDTIPAVSTVNEIVTVGDLPGIAWLARPKRIVSGSHPWLHFSYPYFSPFSRP